MAEIFRIKQGDLRPRLEFRLGFADVEDGAPQDDIDARAEAITTLQTALGDGTTEVRLYVRIAGGALVITNALCEILDATEMRCAYAWQAGETDSPGNFDGEVVVLYGGTTPMTHPTLSTIPIVIEPSVRGAA